MLQEEKIILRPLYNSDAAVLTQLADNRKIWINLRDRFPTPYSLEDANAFISSTEKEDPRVSFAIAYDTSFCGVIGLLLQTDVYRKTAEIGYWIGEPYWNKGIVTIAVKLLTNYAFDELGLIRVYAGIFDYNPGSMKVLQKNGYKQDGIFKKAIFKDGKVFDEYRFSKIK